MKPQQEALQPRLLFFGTCAGEHQGAYLAENEHREILSAAQRVSWLFIRGLDEAAGHKVDVLCSMRVSRYPHFGRLIPFLLPSWERGDGAAGTHVPYLNIPGLCYPTTILAAFARLCSWALRWRGRRKVVVVYAMYTPHMLAALLVARLWGIKTLLIVPDLVQYMNHKKMGALEKLLRRINTRIAGALAGSFDSYAFFASAMTEAIDVHGRPNIVVEGCVDDKAELPPAAADPAPMGERYMLYTGALEAEYGIGMLMEAFDKCADKQIQLYICGRGGYTDAVEKAAAVNGRIHYLGMLALDKVHQLQRSATILVNPRPATSAFTRYSFPSKNLEYLASGRPTVYYVLPGMAEEYSSYAFVPDACSADSMARTFDHVLATPAQELAAKGALAAEFVSREKSSTAQGKRLYELIQQLI